MRKFEFCAGATRRLSAEQKGEDMRVEIFTYRDAERLENALNKFLKLHEGENIEIQYSCSAYQLGSVYYSAMVIFK